MSNTWLTVEFPDEDTLRAAVEAVAAVVSAEGATDESTPAYRAERVLDSALKAVEETSDGETVSDYPTRFGCTDCKVGQPCRKHYAEAYGITPQTQADADRDAKAWARR